MIVHAFRRCGLKKEGGASRETPNRGSHRCHHLLFDARRPGLESVGVR